MPLDPRILTVRALKGASLAQVVLAFLFAQRPLETDEVITWTGLNQEAARNNLRELKNLGFIDKQVLAHNRHVWLPSGDLLPFFQKLQFAGSPRTGSLNTVVVDDESQYKTPLLNLINNNNNNTVQFAGSPRTGENLAALAELKIYGKIPRQVSALEWVTPDYIRAIVLTARDNPAISNPDGFALTQMQEQVPAPEMNPNGHPQTCRCMQCGLGKLNHWQEPEAEEEVQLACLWQEELPEILYNGRHRKTPFCGKPITKGHIKYCDEHLRLAKEEMEVEDE